MCSPAGKAPSSPEAAAAAAEASREAAIETGAEELRVDPGELGAGGAQAPGDQEGGCVHLGLWLEYEMFNRNCLFFLRQGFN